jgi:tetratricopeptide (TPR) repeat protein/tRNA A-37 threonylcarbamoyl transferase component Bud32
MNPPTPEYDLLARDAPARIDAACDEFEQAWKAVPAGGSVPCIASFLAGCDEPERSVLAMELLGLDQACRERYGHALPSERSGDASAAVAEAVTAETSVGLAGVMASRGWSGLGPTLPGLELVALLGSGGMGVVFKGRQAALDRDVAVKLLRVSALTDSGIRERFRQEARAIAKLHHPNLVHVYEFGEVPSPGGAASQPYLVMEYIPGGNLADVVHGAPQPPREAARLVATLAEAIHYAHQIGIIHRVLKPANVLLSFSREAPASATTALAGGSRLNEGVPKITDFGLAKFASGTDLTQTGDVLGTPSYMAPEQTAGKGGVITAAVDVYGLGAILYEALTGRPPFQAETAVATVVQVRQEEPVPPRRLQPTVPSDLETICLKCLRKEAARRYATAQDLADDLRRFQAGESVRARPVGTGERVIVWCRRKPAVAVLLAALVLVFLAGSCGVLWQWQRARRNAAEAEQHAADFRRERDKARQEEDKARQEEDKARQEKDRAERHLQIVRDRVDRLKQLGHNLLRRPGLYGTGQDVLKEALAFYRELLPQEGNDPRLRREAATLFRQVADIHQHIGQTEQAAEAYGQQANLLTTLLKEEPASKDLQMELADTHRWRGNMLRDLGEAREAKEAYDEAARLHEALLDESPKEARYQVALANTLLNKASMLTYKNHAKELECLYRRIVKLDQDAVHAAPGDDGISAELALALGAQAGFFLDMGRRPEAEAAVGEALEIHERLLAGGHLKCSVERYAARNFVTLGRLQAAAGPSEEAEQSFLKAVNLLEPLVEQLPESAVNRAELAWTLAGLADLLTDQDRRRDAEAIYRRVIDHYEKLKADFPKDPNYRRYLFMSYWKLARLLSRMGRQADAAKPYRKAIEIDPEVPLVNNDLAWILATSPEPRVRDAALAVRLAQKAVKARQQSGEYRNTLGVAHYRNGDDKAAVAELETSMRLREGGDSFDWFFLAMAHWRLGNRDQARTWFDRAVQWMDRHKPHDADLRRFRAEAEALLADLGQR